MVEPLSSRNVPCGAPSLAATWIPRAAALSCREICPLKRDFCRGYFNEECPSPCVVGSQAAHGIAPVFATHYFHYFCRKWFYWVPRHRFASSCREKCSSHFGRQPSKDQVNENQSHGRSTRTGSSEPFNSLLRIEPCLPESAASPGRGLVRHLILMSPDAISVANASPKETRNLALLLITLEYKRLPYICNIFLSPGFFTRGNLDFSMKRIWLLDC